MRGGPVSILAAAAIRAHPVIAGLWPFLRGLFERIIEVIGSDENHPESRGER